MGHGLWINAMRKSWSTTSKRGCSIDDQELPITFQYRIARHIVAAPVSSSPGAALFEAGVQFKRERRVYQAREAFMAALAQEPELAAARINLGVLCEEQGLWTMALEYYSTALADPVARANRAELFAQLGQLEAAVADFKRLPEELVNFETFTQCLAQTNRSFLDKLQEQFDIEEETDEVEIHIVAHDEDAPIVEIFGEETSVRIVESAQQAQPPVSSETGLPEKPLTYAEAMNYFPSHTTSQPQKCLVRDHEEMSIRFVEPTEQALALLRPVSDNTGLPDKPLTYAQAMDYFPHITGQRPKCSVRDHQIADYEAELVVARAASPPPPLLPAAYHLESTSTCDTRRKYECLVPPPPPHGPSSLASSKAELSSKLHELQAVLGPRSTGRGLTARRTSTRIRLEARFRPQDTSEDAPEPPCLRYPLGNRRPAAVCSATG